MSSIASSSSSPLPMARAELRSVALAYGRRRFWTIKDPLTLRYYQLREEEKFILDLLDGRHTLEQVIALFEQRFTPQRLRRSELSAFLFMLHREGLVVPAALGQDKHLLARRNRARTDKWVQRMTNVLAIQLGSIHPDRWLSRVVPRLWWMFTPHMALCAGTLVAVAGAIVAVHFATLVERLPRFHEFFGPPNLLWLAVAMALVKTMHELGHAVVCKHLGGECTRMGLMLLVFTPALYCEVTDAWMFPRKWNRIAVSAAGMAVELLLAAAATLLWTVTQPGLLNSVCLNVMFVCSFGTLLINGNPFLRYDGYYILVDLVGVPNLRQQASATLQRWLACELAGVRLEIPPGQNERHVGPLMGYAVASWVYRLVAIVGILWLIHAALEPRGLEVVAQILAVLTAVSLMLAPVRRIGRFLSDPRRRSQVSSRRLFLSIVGLTFLIAALLSVPLPCRVAAPVVLRPCDARPVYVVTGGVLRSSTTEGERVVAGQELAKLSNPTLELEVEVLSSRYEQQRLHIRHLELRQHDTPTLANELPAAGKTLADLQEQLTRKRRELSRLILTAPQAGTVLPPRRKSTRADSFELSGYSGTPLEAANQGCLVEAGSLFCFVGDPSRLEAVALVDESSVPLLSTGQVARIQLAEAPGHLLFARVVEVAHAHVDELPPELMEAGSIPVTRGPDGRSRPLTTIYQVVLAFEAHDRPLLLNASGWARINVASQPLTQRLYRAFRGTFRVNW